MRPLKYQKFWLALGVAYISLIIYLSLTPDPPQVAEFEQSDKIKHCLAYTLLMLYFAQLYESRGAHLRQAAAFLGMGIALEILQGLGGIRTPEFLDAVANGAGVGLGFALARGKAGTLLSRYF